MVSFMMWERADESPGTMPHPIHESTFEHLLREEEYSTLPRPHGGRVGREGTRPRAGMHNEGSHLPGWNMLNLGGG